MATSATPSPATNLWDTLNGLAIAGLQTVATVKTQSYVAEQQAKAQADVQKTLASTGASPTNSPAAAQAAANANTQLIWGIFPSTPANQAMSKIVLVLGAIFIFMVLFRKVRHR